MSFIFDEIRPGIVRRLMCGFSEVRFQSSSSQSSPVRDARFYPRYFASISKLENCLKQGT